MSARPQPSKRTRRLGVRDLIMRDAGCDHPPEPGESTGYVPWFEWIEKYAETHTQGQCPKCGLWVIWTPKQ